MSCLNKAPICNCLSTKRRNHQKSVCECLCEGSLRHCPKPAFRPCPSPSDEHCIKSLQEEKEERSEKFKKKGPAHSTDCKHLMRFRRRGESVSKCSHGIDWKSCDVPQFINFVPEMDDLSWRLTKLPCDDPSIALNKKIYEKSTKNVMCKNAPPSMLKKNKTDRLPPSAENLESDTDQLQEEIVEKSEIIDQRSTSKSKGDKPGGASTAKKAGKSVTVSTSPIRATSPKGAKLTKGAGSPKGATSPTRANSPTGADSPTRANSPTGDNSPKEATYHPGDNSPTGANSPAGTSSPTTTKSPVEQKSVAVSPIRAKSPKGKKSIAATTSPKGDKSNGRKSVSVATSPVGAKSPKGRKSIAVTTSPEEAKSPVGRKSIAVATSPARAYSPAAKKSTELTTSPKRAATPTGVESPTESKSSIGSKPSAGRGKPQVKIL